MQTVSNALNRPELLHPDTLSVVKQAIQELGYRANTAARALRQGGITAIGWLVLAPEGSAALGFPEECSMLIGGLVGARAQGVRLVIGADDCHDNSPEDSLRAFALEGSLEGVIVTGSLWKPSGEGEGRALPPHVHLGREIPEERSIFLDEGSAVARWIGDLTRFGAERVAFLGRPNHRQNSFRARHRRLGFERGIRTHHLRKEHCPVVECGEDELDSALGRLVHSPLGPRALLVEGWARFHRVAQLLQGLGRGVPDDVMLVAIPDDSDPLHAESPPEARWATVTTPWNAVGERGVSTLVALLRGDLEGAPQRQRLEGRPTEGASAAPPAATGTRRLEAEPAHSVARRG